jgi:hypothetical protein
MNQRGTMLAATAWLLLAGLCSVAAATEPAVSDSTYEPLLEPANWQAPAGEELVPTPSPGTPLPYQSPLPAQPPLLDNLDPQEDTTTALEDESLPARRGVQPYGGGHAGDWSWGCGGSPFRTGPGWCDTWEVGCRWDVAVDGIVMMREETDLAALVNLSDETSTGLAQGSPDLEQFDYGPGGRVTFISKVPCYNWQMHFAYEGIEEWNASVVYPKFSPIPNNPDFNNEFIPPDSSEQRTVNYRSSLHSAELSFMRMCNPVWRPYCGVRYIKFDDEINDTIDQEAPIPPFFSTPSVFDVTQDRFNIFDIENNLIGFQIGLRHDLWRPNRRVAIEGFVNSGVYYNRIKHTNLMGVYSLQQFSDDPSTPNVNESALFDEPRVANNDIREYSEISYVSEASVSGVCRLNRCWALRAGYQALWISNLRLAEDAYLGTDLEGRSLFFHGWHAGVEHRR